MTTRGVKGEPIVLRGGNYQASVYQRSGELVLSGPAGTGKTLASLYRVWQYGNDYPGARMLIVRKTRASLTESALVTWEQMLERGGASVILGNPIARTNRHHYVFPNGSVLVTGGLDKPDKILSTEWDLIYVPEATDLSLLEWETLSGRLRAGAGPYDLIFGDCNPTTPTHWIYRRAKRRKLKLIPTTHFDNPRFFDTARQKWTPDGIRYLKRLGRLTGARKARFLKGLWVAAEGLVYDGYDEWKHMRHPAGWVPPDDWERVWGLDFGFQNPMSLTMWAIDPDQRLHLYREWYVRQTRVEVLAKRVMDDLTRRGDRTPVCILADHDPENVETFQVYSGLSVTMADKQRRDDGIEAVQARFDVAGDGRPRLFLARDCLAHPPDESLIDEGKPTCLADELVGYVWDTRDPKRVKDEPLKANDHAMDGMRYVCRWVESYDRMGPPVYGTAGEAEGEFTPSKATLSW